jgi:hypothetical protein
MSESLIFGNVKRFAIEISRPAKKARLRLWVGGKPFGEFKRSGELLHSAEDLRLLLQHMDSLTERALARKTPPQIFAWLLSTPSHALYQKRRKYIRFLGDQMDHLTMFSRLHEGQLEWTFYDNRAKVPNFTTVLLDKSVVTKVCTKYLAWCERLPVS